MRYYKINEQGEKEYFKNPIHQNGRDIFTNNPKAFGYIEETPVPTVEYVPTYKEKVEDYIREKYTVSDELAILRQRDTKPEEYAEYYAYCEECKAKAKS